MDETGSVFTIYIVMPDRRFFCWNLAVREVRAGIASDQAFEGVTWEKDTGG